MNNTYRTYILNVSCRPNKMYSLSYILLPLKEIVYLRLKLPGRLIEKHKCKVFESRSNRC